MSDSGDKSDPGPAKRGQAAWKAVKAKIADRNDEVQKAGRQERADYQREKEQRRAVQAHRESARLQDMNEKRSK